MPTQTLEEADWSYSNAPIDESIPKVDATIDEDIFSCDKAGLEALKCPFTILGKIWDKFRDFMNVIANFIRAMMSVASPV